MINFHSRPDGFSYFIPLKDNGVPDWDKKPSLNDTVELFASSKTDPQTAYRLKAKITEVKINEYTGLIKSIDVYDVASKKCEFLGKSVEVEVLIRERSAISEDIHSDISVEEKAGLVVGDLIDFSFKNIHTLT
ncbi:hypothetical protein QX249_11900 [Vibrio parahaemolyticus]|uniref:Uncharacterized protein n=1 Tax=Vibrio parahaemolyticus TaxID=670 RepID=A0AAW8PZB7_VIBPH|nr:hypothetical protein [Vibrio parahaemolyticus]EGR2227315.1 hypothetical protein [Vibrio parahaemolyticus]MDS1821364.1 hypothetical protein [Vibrio parahaemolyticus]